MITAGVHRAELRMPAWTSGSSARVFTNSRQFHDKARQPMRHLLIRSDWADFTSAGWDRGLQAFRHQEGMGKNWRSHRRGCERRFVSGGPGFLLQVLALPLPHRRRAFLGFSNCYNFEEQNSRKTSAMKCPFCGFANDKVVDSRESKEAESIRRRRECLKCGKRFTTYERIDEIPYMVVKKDGRREKFDRQKVLNGLLRACEKRPVPISKLEQIVNEAESFVIESAERERKTSELGELIMNRLRRYDKVAYVRFASVYLDFKDVKEFMNELKDLVKVKTG
jgi:transcriptional repressor NrdR